MFTIKGIFWIPPRAKISMEGGGSTLSSCCFEVIHNIKIVSKKVYNYMVIKIIFVTKIAFYTCVKSIRREV